jgi:uncharacterized protein YjbJ (UPF0337 family)
VLNAGWRRKEAWGVLSGKYSDDLRGLPGPDFRVAGYIERITNKENVMGREDIAAGKVKQIKGTANDIAGAVTGNTGQQIKGKAQKAMGKVQEAVGKATSKKKP